MSNKRYEVIYPNGLKSEIDPYFVDMYCPNKEDMRTPFTGYRIVEISETARNVRDSISAVVNMMNNGVGINPAEVYPRGRYQGD